MLIRIIVFLNYFYKDLDGFRLNHDIINSLKGRFANQERVIFMIYNQKIWNYYHNFERQRIFHILLILYSSIVFSFGLFFNYFILTL